jgi:hypothetical protein
MPIWRSKDDQAIEPTTGRRRVDIVVNRDLTPVALIETIAAGSVKLQP